VGSLESEINARLAAAERLLASASLVGDRSDHALWRTSRALWVKATIDDLRGHVGEEVIRTFERAVMPPPGEGILAEDLPVELEAIRESMAVLLGIRSQAAPAPSGAAPAAERRRLRLGP
jgi:hypothetical protein